MSDVCTTRRQHITPARRVRIWEGHAGRCVICGGKIDGVRERWIIEHVRALELGGTNADDNLGPAHETCGIEKTRDDHSRAAKAKRQKAAHIGAKPKRPWHPTLRKKLNGEVVPR
jgi:5-methylcytosine-specific restriction endonuclease McrA